MATRTYRPLQMHRIAYTDLTESQVAQALRPAASGPVLEYNFEAMYVKVRGQSKIESLNWRTT